MSRTLLHSLAVILLLSNACSNQTSVYVEVIAHKDTVKAGEMYIAEIQLRNYDYTEGFVENYVVRKGIDTVMLDWDDETFYGVYRATSSNTGDRFFEGYVVYQKEGRPDKLHFRKDYYITEK